MHIGIDARPLEGQAAGIGAYVAGLLSGLAKTSPRNNFLLFSYSPVDTQVWGANFQNKVFRPNPLWHLQVANFIKAHGMIYHSTHSLLDAVLLKNRSILTVHDLTALTLKAGHTLKVSTINKLFLKRAVGGVSQVIVPTQVVKQELIGATSPAQEKTTVIYEAVEDDFGARAKKEALKKYGLETGYILFNGTLEPRKNIPFLLQAFSKVKERPILVLAGKKGWGYKLIEEEIKHLELSSQVKVLDWVPGEDLESLYQFAALLIYPSLNEGFGLSPLKAFKVGVPVIVSDLPVFTEVLGEAALKFSLTNVASLTQALEKVLKEKELQLKLIQKGFDQVAKYSWEKTARETLEIYQKVADENS